jgi:hypothetical protein
MNMSGQYLLWRVFTKLSIPSREAKIYLLFILRSFIVLRQGARSSDITKRVLFKVNDHSTRERIANIISRALSTGYSSEAVHDLKELQNQIKKISGC